MEGWIKFYRQISDNPIWTLEPFTKGQAWADLLLLANHKEGQISVRGNIIPIKRGQVGWSEVKLSERWQWSRGKVRRFLNYLKTEQMIEQQKNSLSSIITILNWNLYQSTEQQTIQQTDSRRYTNNNDKNEKNIYSVLEYWNETNIIKHKSLKEKDKRKINSSLRDFSLKEIKVSISNYAEILNSDEYFFNYKWTLADFLSRGIEKFLDIEVARENYRINKFGNNGHDPNKKEILELNS